jgi:LDH2 family malate/lactate/ureidoglycolate dehydrogenase
LNVKIEFLIFKFCRAFGAPAKNGDSFVLDMATSTVALGKVEISQRRGIEIPNTWGVDEQGLY